VTMLVVTADASTQWRADAKTHDECA